MPGHYTMPRTSCPATKATKKRSVKKNMKGGSNDASLNAAISRFHIFFYHGKLNYDDDEYNKNEKLRAEILQDNNIDFYDFQNYLSELYSDNHSHTKYTEALEEILLPFYNNADFNKIIKNDIDLIYKAVVEINKKNDDTTGIGGGSQSKEILGKQRRIYKVAGSRKEHIKYKGQLIPVSDYKKLFKK
jgi:hypothetical protein